MSTKNEKIIYTVLKKISTDRQFISSAYKTWHEDINNLPFDADEIVTYFEKKIGLDVNEKRNFRIAFYSISSRSEIDLLEVPDILLKNNIHSNANNPEIPDQETIPNLIEKLSPQEKTFQMFISYLLDVSKRTDQDADSDLADHLQDIKTIKDMKLSSSSNEHIKTWLTSHLTVPLNPTNMTQKEMKALFHQIYVSLCETLGPVKTDQVLGQSIKHVEALNTGFSVSSLI